MEYIIFTENLVIMKFFLFILTASVLASCAGFSMPATGGSYPVNSTNTVQVEKEYQELAKNYDQNTAGIVDELINGNPNSTTASVLVENTSPCNLVLSIAGNNYFKKIPIGAGQTRGALVNKGTYRLSASVCGSGYNSVKNIQETISIKLRN